MPPVRVARPASSMTDTVEASSGITKRTMVAMSAHKKPHNREKKKKQETTLASNRATPCRRTNQPPAGTRRCDLTAHGFCSLSLSFLVPSTRVVRQRNKCVFPFQNSPSQTRISIQPTTRTTVAKTFPKDVPLLAPHPPLSTIPLELASEWRHDHSNPPHCVRHSIFGEYVPANAVLWFSVPSWLCHTQVVSCLVSARPGQCMQVDFSIAIWDPSHSRTRRSS